MTKLQEIEKKIEQFRKEKNEVELKKQLIMQSEELTKQVADGISKLNSYLDSEVNKDIVNILKKYVSDLNTAGDLQEKNRLSFEKQLLKIINGFTDILEKQAIVNQNQIPNGTAYIRTNGKISRVIETYDKFTLIHIWSYDGEGNLVSVKTTKNDQS
ncbi:MAG: hypothetical protein ACEQR7_06095 [Agathobacter rectalis]